MAPLVSVQAPVLVLALAHVLAPDLVLAPADRALVAALVAHVPVVVLVARVLADLVALVLVLVHVLVAVPVQEHLARADPVVHVLVADLVVPVVHVMVSVVHLARSHARVVVASSMNCSRNSLNTRTAMHLFPREQSLLSAVGQHKSSLRN